METRLIVIMFLGFALVLMPTAVGARYVKERLLENHRLERRLRDLN